ncbi:hypothetical protein H5410_040630 [Solanum commersonii]|uniref:Uncharacterized protein n=1 Tax=Solanum commersonii TaxID=4109 RepID=A0A9J5XRZ8_SOLCO|nr:hypothetical protein H5410_040630 [Solanum commersonii]
MEKELQQIKSQQHDNKHAELSPSDDSKIPELEGDDGKHRKTQTNNLLHVAIGTASTSATKEENKIRYANANMTKLFDKPFIPKTQKDIFIPPQVNTYKESLGQHKQTYNHITQAYIENIHKIQTFLNQNPRSTNTKNPHEDYITQNLQGYNKLIAQPEKIVKEEEIQKIEIPAFYARKRIIGLATILNELATNYLNENTIWSYYARDQMIIYSNCRETRPADMEEIRQWVLSLLKPEQKPTTRAIRQNFISTELMKNYCKTIGHKYLDHHCSKCYGEDNIIPAVNLE